MSRYPLPVEQRLWARVEKGAANECWNWTGAVNSHGYGTIRERCVSKGTHVVAYRAAHGAVPNGALICHTCDNRRCCNPAHLYAGSFLSNAQDREQRNRSRHQRGEATGHARLTAPDVALIRHLAACGVRQTKLAALFGVTQSAVSMVARRRSWAHVRDLLHGEALP